jgi:hypothetical protein
MTTTLVPAPRVVSGGGGGGGALPAGVENIITVADDQLDQWWTDGVNESGTQFLLRPNSNGVGGGTLDDETSLLTMTGGIVRTMVANTGDYVYNGWDDASPGAGAVQTGSVIMRFALQRLYVGSELTIIEIGGAVGDGDAAENVTFLLALGTTYIKYLHESGTGDNHEVRWTLAENAYQHNILYGALVRVDIGGGDCEVRLFLSVDGGALALQTVASVSGMTDNTTYATGTNPNDGSEGEVHFANGVGPRYMLAHFLTGTTTLAAEQARLDALQAM